MIHRPGYRAGWSFPADVRGDAGGPAVTHDDRCPPHTRPAVDYCWLSSENAQPAPTHKHTNRAFPSAPDRHTSHDMCVYVYHLIVIFLSPRRASVLCALSQQTQLNALQITREHHPRLHFTATHMIHWHTWCCGPAALLSVCILYYIWYKNNKTHSFVTSQNIYSRSYFKFTGSEK